MTVTTVMIRPATREASENVVGQWSKEWRDEGGDADEGRGRRDGERGMINLQNLHFLSSSFPTHLQVFMGLAT